MLKDIKRKMIMKNITSKKYNISLSLLAVVLSVYIGFVLQIAFIPFTAILIHVFIDMASIIALFLIPKPFFKSQNWFYKLIFSAVYCIAMYLGTADYVQFCTANSKYDIIRWLILWGTPVLIHYAFCGIDKLLTNSYKQGKRAGRIWKSWTVCYSPLHRTEKKKNKFRIANLPDIVLFFAATLLIATTLYLKVQFPDTELSVILFTLKFVQGSIAIEIIRIIAIFVAMILFFNILFIAGNIRNNGLEKFELQSPDKSESFVMNRSELEKGILKKLPLIMLLAGSVIFLMDQVDLVNYVIKQNTSSTIYEDYYVKPDMQLLTFPEKKKNLIYISAESMENSFTSFENGGIQTTDHIPNLTKLASDNINFSNNGGLGGASVFYPSVSYTIGSCVAQTSGISFPPYLNNIINTNTPGSALLPSAVKLENILSDAGYNQLFMKSERSTFAGFDLYYGHAKNARLFDYDDALNEGYIPKDYCEHWGFEDITLFRLSKEFISELSQKDEPFAVTIFTLDTHMPEGGFRCKLCDPNVADNRTATIECSDRQISDFVKWVQEQPFADDTVIIIYGDHLSPIESRPLFRKMPSDYVRTTYNCMINTQKTPVTEKNRKFTSMDMFPTILSALGVEIEGDRLGLGTDLFSATPTLCEEIGQEKFLDQIQSSSKYFNREFWKVDP